MTALARHALSPCNDSSFLPFHPSLPSPGTRRQTRKALFHPPPTLPPPQTFRGEAQPESEIDGQSSGDRRRTSYRLPELGAERKSCRWPEEKIDLSFFLCSLARDVGARKVWSKKTILESPDKRFIAPSPGVSTFLEPFAWTTDLGFSWFGARTTPAFRSFSIASPPSLSSRLYVTFQHALNEACHEADSASPGWKVLRVSISTIEEESDHQP